MLLTFNLEREAKTVNHSLCRLVLLVVFYREEEEIWKTKAFITHFDMYTERERARESRSSCAEKETHTNRKMIDMS